MLLRVGLAASDTGPVSSAASEDDIRSWVEAVASLHNTVAHDQDAREPVVGLRVPRRPIAGSGDARAGVQAIEAGYATGLYDLRAGRLDEAVREWRPDLITG